MLDQTGGDRVDKVSEGVFRWKFAEAEFDEARWELLVAGAPVRLERKPLEVLACLLRHAGEVVTKDELLDSAWAGRIVVEAFHLRAVVTRVGTNNLRFYRHRYAIQNPPRGSVVRPWGVLA